LVLGVVVGLGNGRQEKVCITMRYVNPKGEGRGEDRGSSDNAGIIGKRAEGAPQAQV